MPIEPHLLNVPAGTLTVTSDEFTTEVQGNFVSTYDRGLTFVQREALIFADWHVTPVLYGLRTLTWQYQAGWTTWNWLRVYLTSLGMGNESMTQAELEAALSDLGLTVEAFEALFPSISDGVPVGQAAWVYGYGSGPPNSMSGYNSYTASLTVNETYAECYATTVCSKEGSSDKLLVQVDIAGDCEIEIGGGEFTSTAPDDPATTVTTTYDPSVWYISGGFFTAHAFDASFNEILPGPDLTLHSISGTYPAYTENWQTQIVPGAASPIVRTYPRDDGRGLSSAPRIHPPSKARRIHGGFQ